MADFKTVLVTDDRIANITDKIGYAVASGGENITQSSYNAVSASTSSHTWNIQVPSLSTLIDRTVVWGCTTTLQIVGTPPAGKFLIDYGNTDALAPFPNHSLINVLTCTINNNSLSSNLKDLMAPLMRVNDKRLLNRYNSSTPTQFDTYFNYADGLLANNNVLGGYQNGSLDNDFAPRGAWVLDRVSIDPPGSGAENPLTVSTGAQQTVYVTYTTYEPMLLSPWMFYNQGHSNQALTGVQNLNFVANIGSGNRVWRTSNRMTDVVPGTPTYATVTPYQFANSRLIFTFITPQASQLLPVSTVVPYYDLPRYLTSFSAILPACTPATATVPQQLKFVPMRTSSISLNCIPDKIILFVRKAMSSQTNGDSDSFLVINQLSINFNNASGLLASATQNQLWTMAVEAGSSQSFQEFSGFASSYVSPTSRGAVPLSGSLIMLDFSKHIQLPSYLAPSSLGNFVLNISLNVANQGSVDIPQSEIVLITMNSGIFKTERGSSSVYTGILGKQSVLDAQDQEPYSGSDFQRIIGGGTSGGGAWDTMKNLASKVAPLAKMGLSLLDNKYAKAGASALDSMGYGKKKVDPRLL